ncbi:hypothetical protein [Motilibacter rhizosphaerae]|uniref:hypothetical protein n=1 Tax=Motilibacter rhizosphaerae TaxID=598652 RepID=UPI00102BE101|nr:hypothetical protein [Motilibacter rhizosphaerae]
MTLPDSPSRGALADVVRDVRREMLTGSVRVDATAARGWPPRARLVVARLRRVAVLTGCRWTELPS